MNLEDTIFFAISILCFFLLISTSCLTYLSLFISLLRALLPFLFLLQVNLSYITSPSSIHCIIFCYFKGSGTPFRRPVVTSFFFHFCLFFIFLTYFFLYFPSPFRLIYSFANTILSFLHSVLFFTSISQFYHSSFLLFMYPFLHKFVYRVYQALHVSLFQFSLCLSLCF